MKIVRLILLLVVAILCLPSTGHAQGVPPGAKAQVVQQPSAMDTAGLFVADEDIARMTRVLPGLANASRLGSREATSYLARSDISYDRMTQVLTNLSVAYTAIKFQEWMSELRPLLDTSKTSAYSQLVAQSQRRLDSLTANYRKAIRGQRSALDLNEDAVRRRMPEIETLLLHVQRLNVAALPSHD